MPILNCKCCSKEYHVPNYRKDTSKYCSTNCQNKGQYLSIIKICPTCSKEFKVSNSRVKTIYCSSECRHATNTDLVNRRKKVKRAAIVSRGVSTSKTLRKFVFDIKPKKCEACGYNEYEFCLDIHHIDENARNNDINNLAVLCCMCHKKLHKGVLNYAS